MTNDALIAALSHLVSEGRNPDTMDIDLLPSLDIVQRINQQDKLVPLAVEKVLPEIAQAVDKITDAFKVGGRLIYMGAGTSGRLGKSYQNLMVDVKATNNKLVARAARIVMQATECTKEEATEVLKQTNYEVKLAILMILISSPHVSTFIIKRASCVKR